MEKSSDSHCPSCDDALWAKLTLFAELNRDELQTLLHQSSREHFAAGAKIVSFGDEGYCMYVILRGSARVTVPSPEGDVELAILQAGDFFGEVALVDDGPRTADVTALEECELLCITRMTLGVLAGLQPGAAIHLLASIGRALVSRLRVGHRKYMDLLSHPA